MSHCKGLFILALALGACGKSSDFDALAKEACACKDKACAESVNKKLDAAVDKLTSEKELEKASGAIGEAAACLAKLGITAK